MSTGSASVPGANHAHYAKKWLPAGHLKGYQNPSRKREKKKEKKMGWFRRKFAEWSQRAWEDARDHPMPETIVGANSLNSTTSMRFTVYPASGGYVIEHYKQDRYKDGDGPQLTIVNNGDSLGTAVEHIITLEALKS